MRVENASSERNQRIHRIALVVAMLLACLVVGLAASAQEEEPPRTVIKMLRYVDAVDLLDVVRMLEVQVTLQEEHNALVLRAPDRRLQVALEAIEALDSPLGPTLELRGYILAASRDGESEALPDDVGAASARLAELFGYRGFRLLDTVFLRVREGSEAWVEGSLPNDGGGRAQYSFGFRKGKVIPAFEEGEKVQIRLDRLTFSQQGKNKLVTNVEVDEGQTVVVGKAQLEGVEAALILVIKMEIED